MRGKCSSGGYPVLALVGAALLGGGCQGHISYSFLADSARPSRGAGHTRQSVATGEAARTETVPASHQSLRIPGPNTPGMCGAENVTLARLAQHAHESVQPAAPLPPRELCKESLPPYVIEPPDTLQIEVVRLVPLPSYRAGPLPVRGDHCVSLDGTINLGPYGCVYVTGLTIPQAKAAIERHLSGSLLNSEISLAVSGTNSKVYYIITDGPGLGEQVFRFPLTGNETVLDALSNLHGTPPAGSRRRVWLARPSPPRKEGYQVLPVDWEAITRAGSTETNYQIFPGDRIYVKTDKLTPLDSTLTRILSPFRRPYGGTLMGRSAVRTFERPRDTTGPRESSVPPSSAPPDAVPGPPSPTGSEKPAAYLPPALE